MEHTITISVWMIPVILTILFFVIAWIKIPPSSGFLGDSIESLMYNTLALICSLIVWLIYAMFI